MTVQELRLECLRLAIQNARTQTSAKFIVSEAALFHSFLLCGHKQDHVTQHKDPQEKLGHQNETDSVVKQQIVVAALTPELHALLSQLQG